MDVIVLAKEPVPGRVKTRLCPPCTPAQAAALASAALADTLATARGSGADRVVLALDGRRGDWCPPGVHVVDQGAGDLASRLARAWTATAGPALQIGMDTPQLTSDQLDAAMATLAGGSVDAVLGPAIDGGWWAIGLRQPHPLAFAGIPTSRPDTGARQAARLAALGLRTRQLPQQRDVDTWADALTIAAAHPHTAFAAVTRRVAAALPPTAAPGTALPVSTSRRPARSMPPPAPAPTIGGTRSVIGPTHAATAPSHRCSGTATAVGSAGEGVTPVAVAAVAEPAGAEDR